MRSYLFGSRSGLAQLLGGKSPGLTAYMTSLEWSTLPLYFGRSPYLSFSSASKYLLTRDSVPGRYKVLSLRFFGSSSHRRRTLTPPECGRLNVQFIAGG